MFDPAFEDLPPTYPQRSSQAWFGRRLLEETRGAVMVVGIVLGALLVGALYYLASVGDAIVWREAAQNAADAGAFDNAIWHARGMNMIAAINILMSLVLSVLVIWRLVLVILFLVSLITLIVSILDLGVTAPALIPEGSALAEMIAADEEVAMTVVLILSGMSAAEVAVASYTPVLATPAAALDTMNGYKVVAGTFSASLLPTADLGTITGLLTCFTGKAGKGEPGAAGGGGAHAPGGSSGSGHSAGSSGSGTSAGHSAGNAAGEGEGAGSEAAKDALLQLAKFAQNSEAIPGVTNKLGMPFSLPVQGDKYSVLCKKAGEFWPHQLQGVFDRMGEGSPAKFLDHLGPLKDVALGALGFGSAYEGVMANIAGWITGSSVGSIIFCVPWSTTLQEFMMAGYNLIQKANSDAAKAEQKSKNDENVFEHGVNVAKNLFKSITDVTKIWDNITYLLEVPSDDTQCGNPAKVWEPAQNGNIYMRSTAVVVKQVRTAATDAGLEIADGNRSGNLVQANAQPIWAHAEMYFDCDGGWKSCEDDAMWQLRWTARLRRMQPFGALLREAEARPETAASGNGVAILGLLEAVAETIGGIVGISSEQIDNFFPADEAQKIQETSTYSAVSHWAAQRVLGGSSGQSMGGFIVVHGSSNSEIH